MAHLPLIDLSSSAGRAIVLLVDLLKEAEDGGGLNGGDVVQLLTRWMEGHGLDPRAPAGSLGSRPPVPCGHCPADIWPGPSDGEETPADRGTHTGIWQDRDGAVHCRTAGDSHTATWCGPECDREQPRHRPLRVRLGTVTGTVARIEPGDGHDDGWLLAPDDGAHYCWTPASHAHVLEDADSADAEDDTAVDPPRRPTSAAGTAAPSIAAEPAQESRW